MRNPFAAPTIHSVLLDGSDCAEAEAEFFNHLRLPNGTFKTTRPGRLRDVDELLVEHLPRSGAPLRILDVGVIGSWCRASAH